MDVTMVNMLYQFNSILLAINIVWNPACLQQSHGNLSTDRSKECQMRTATMVHSKGCYNGAHWKVLCHLVKSVTKGSRRQKGHRDKVTTNTVMVMDTKRQRWQRPKGTLIAKFKTQQLKKRVLIVASDRNHILTLILHYSCIRIC